MMSDKESKEVIITIVFHDLFDHCVSQIRTDAVLALFQTFFRG